MMVAFLIRWLLFLTEGATETNFPSDEYIAQFYDFAFRFQILNSDASDVDGLVRVIGNGTSVSLGVPQSRVQFLKIKKEPTVVYFQVTKDGPQSERSALNLKFQRINTLISDLQDPTSTLQITFQEGGLIADPTFYPSADVSEIVPASLLTSSTSTSTSTSPSDTDNEGEQPSGDEGAGSAEASMEFPVWAIVVVIVASLLILSTVAYGVYLYTKQKRVDKQMKASQVDNRHPAQIRPQQQQRQKKTSHQHPTAQLPEDMPTPTAPPLKHNRHAATRAGRPGVRNAYADMTHAGAPPEASPESVGGLWGPLAASFKSKGAPCSQGHTESPRHRSNGTLSDDHTSIETTPQALERIHAEASRSDHIEATEGREGVELPLRSTGRSMRGLVAEASERTGRSLHQDS